MRDRDQAVADALRELDDVPEHQPGFWTDLHERLTLGTPAVVPVRRRRLGSARWLAIAAAVVILAGGALVALRSGGDEAPTTRVVPAGPDVVRSLQGVLVTEVRGEQPQRWTFALHADGRFVARSGETGVASSPQSGLSVGVLGDGQVFAKKNAPLGPVGVPADQSGIALLRRDVGWAVAALAAGGDEQVTTGEQDGRPVWRFAGDIPPNPLAGGAGVDHLVAVVDRASRVPLLLRETSRGRLVAEQRIETLKVGAAIDESTFTFGVPMPKAVDDLGWRRVDVSTADVPKLDVPEGYRLAEVAIHDGPLVTGPEGGNPGTGPVLSMAYRRGIDVLVVTIQPSGTGNLWDDPLGQEGVAVKAQPFDTGGILRGGIVIDPRVVPHAWADTAGRVVTVAGAATGSQLAAVVLSVPDVTLVTP